MNSKGTVLITGASSGIGETFAHKLATYRYHLILVARRREKLEQLSASLQERYSITAEVCVADLSQTDEIEKVARRIATQHDLRLLINNAGFGVPGMFVDMPLERQMDMINVHITATLRLTKAALPGMMQRCKGAIINVSSVAAFLPMPGSVDYAASKVYLINFSSALQTELRDTGVQVQALCPGFTHTGFHYTPEYEKLKIHDAVPRWMWMSSEAVVTESLRALRRHQVVCIPGFKNKVMIALAGNGLVLPIMQKIVGRQRK